MVINFDCEPSKGIKFKGVTGGIDYLLSKEDRSVEPIVLSGNPDLTREILKQNHYSKPYSAGCLSFEEFDIPFDEKQKHMESFEKMLLAGLTPEQYDICWVQHQDKGRLELNYHIVNTELSTGKRLQPWWKKRDEPRVNAWKQLVNDEYGYSSPDDPEHKRSVSFGNNNPTRKEVIEQVDNYIFPMVASGEIKNSDDLKNTLNSIKGVEFIKQTKSATTIKVDEFEKNIRLKGDYYGKGFGDFGRYAEVERERVTAYNAGRDQRIRDNKEKLSRFTAKISKDRRAQYAPSRQKQQKENDLSPIVANPINNVIADIHSNERQLSDDEILREQLSNLHRIRDERPDSDVQNKTNNNNEMVNKNESYNIRATEKPEVSNDEQSGRFITILRRAFKSIMDKIGIVGNGVEERTRGAEATRSQYQDAARLCEQASERVGQAIERELLAPKPQPKMPRKQHGRTQDPEGLGF